MPRQKLPEPFLHQTDITLSRGLRLILKGTRVRGPILFCVSRVSLDKLAGIDAVLEACRELASWIVRMFGGLMQGTRLDPSAL